MANEKKVGFDEKEAAKLEPVAFDLEQLVDANKRLNALIDSKGKNGSVSLYVEGTNGGITYGLNRDSDNRVKIGKHLTFDNAGSARANMGRPAEYWVEIDVDGSLRDHAGEKDVINRLYSDHPLTPEELTKDLDLLESRAHTR